MAGTIKAVLKTFMERSKLKTKVKNQNRKDSQKTKTKKKPEDSLEEGYNTGQKDVFVYDGCFCFLKTPLCF